MFRHLKASASAGLTAESIHLLPYERFPMVRVLSVYSRFIHQKFRQLKWFDEVMYAAQSCIICVVAPVKLPALPRRQSELQRVLPDSNITFDFAFLKVSCIILVIITIAQWDGRYANTKNII